MTRTGEQGGGLIWREGYLPVSARFGDPYFSPDGGLAESRHVFLAGNDLPGRFRDGFHIAELGFGTGLNLVAALDAWRRVGQVGVLRYTAFERYPLDSDDMAQALAAFPEIAPVAEEFLARWRPGQAFLRLADLEFRLIEGDARHTLPRWHGRADAWFLDGFAPARNPEMWTPALMAEVARHTRPGGSFVTFTAAGHVRRALAAAGFRVARVAGFGRKRHMSRGVLVPQGAKAGEVGR